MNYLIIDKIIKDALIEDGVFDDITTNSICSEDKEAEIDIIFKEKGILCGSHIFKRVFDILGGAQVEFFYSEGAHVDLMETVGKIKGSAITILSGERVALNILQRLSGIATTTRDVVNELKSTGIKVADTRKTTPNLRYIEKYAVKIGGGMNHRYNLSDMAMIKDNHIMAAGSIKKAVEAVRREHPIIKNIEVECESLTQVKEAIDAGADIIMLDNMDYATMKEACMIIEGRAKVEVSGNITLDKIKSLKDLDIDYFSSGALTHSVKALDISMKNLRLL